MKKLLLFMFMLASICSAACAETAREYAAWLEEAVPGAAFMDAEVPDFVLEKLGGDYDFIARTDAKYGSYIAGVRRDDAPQLPADIYVQSAGSFETALFQAVDGAGKVYYNFTLTDGVQMHAYDGLAHLVIHADEAQSQYNPFEPDRTIIFDAADPRRRAQLIYGTENGFSMEDESRAQLCMEVHTIDSWRAGATDQPHTFYLDVDAPANLMGERHLTEEDLIQFTRIPIGLYLKNGKTSCSLVISESGVKGIETDEPHRLYEAGAGFDILVDIAEDILGYHPGDADFIGKQSIRATLQWQGGSASIEDAQSLRRLDEMFSRADFSVGSVNCPSPCFLTVDYSDGSSASMAVAVNSFDLFFFNGLYFTAGDGELLDIFMLDMEDITYV